MRVVHVGMVMTDGTTSVFSGDIINGRWRDRSRNSWSGRYVSDTGFRHTFHGRIDWHEVQRLERELAARLGLPAMNEAFPVYCPECRKFCGYERRSDGSTEAPTPSHL